MMVLVLVALVAGASAEWAVRRLACEIEPTVGTVGDCGCEFEDVDSATHEFFGPILRNLTQRKFFQYFQVDLDKACPFWDIEGMCQREACAVDTTTEAPESWVEEDEARRAWAVERTTSVSWVEEGGEEVWIEQGPDMAYIDLLRNPEKFTGYDGDGIWSAIYRENCFQDTEVPATDMLLNAYRRVVRKEGQCLERRIFYRLISGLQSSISTHIAKSEFDWKFLLRENGWLQGLRTLALGRPFANDPVFVARVGAHKERLHNLYFAYLFLLRAATRAKDDLVSYDYDTGNPEDDAMTRELVRILVEDDGCVARHAFDDSMLFKPPEDARMSPLEKALARESVEDLRAEFLGRFRNISKIMDCVTCERCRLWGKLQILGIGTALKILMMEGDAAGLGALQRNEVVALVNTLAQLAKSVDSVHHYWQRRDLKRGLAQWALLLSPLLLLFLTFQSTLKKRNNKIL
ncbi:hypothetical protein CTAYLR_005423 [Chrysophaeum taylorii]|uniref:Uncharacterized protein n=1 Tax=Chrysophaeum taylorii TaxID=2483200 RepID=A0AAD7XKP4_9STRA|nr:hypothetical protein CTAYLR_005423 [Chrysophaeum taylorii]